MYAHTDSVLYEVDSSYPYELTLVGAFGGGISGVQFTDLAMAPTGILYAITSTDVYEVDPSTAQVAWLLPVGEGHLDSMTAMADGTLLAGEHSTFYRIDPVGLTAEVYATIPGREFTGDMVALPDGLLYCLAEDVEGGGTALIEYDPATNQTRFVGWTGHGTVSGVGLANGTLLGFDDSGQILEFDTATGAATVVATPGQAFWGATANPTYWD